MDSWHLLLEIVSLLAACLAAGAILSRLGQSPIVGYLLAGMLLGGPGSFHVIHAEEDIETIAELGVSLLLFSLGLEFSWQRLKQMGLRSLSSGAIQVGATMIAGAFVSIAFGLGLAESIAIGAMLSLSSTAAVLRVLIDRAEIDSLHGRGALAILLVQDMAVVPLAVVVTLLAGGGSFGDVVLTVSKILFLAAALIGVLYVLLDKLAVRALGSLSLEQNRELTILLAIVIGLGSTWAAHAVGLSPALGAFIAGMFLGSSPFATQVRADVASLRVVLLTLFFGSVGMVADPIWIVERWWLVLAVAFAVIAGKAVIVWGILRVWGIPHGIAIATGLCLAQIGEFAFVLGSSARESSVVGEPTYLLVVSSAILTLFVTPYLVGSAPRLGYRLERFFRRSLETLGASAEPGEAAPPDILIIGFGPAGKAVGAALVEHGQTATVLDLNALAKSAAESMGLSGQIGDARFVDVLEHARVRSARMVVVTLPVHEAAIAVLQHVRRLAPAATVIVRSRHQIHHGDFERAGAHAIVGDEIEVGRALSERVLAELT